MFRSLLVLAASLWAATSAFAADAPSLYVVPIVFLPATRDPTLSAAAGALSPRAWGDTFARHFRGAFPGATDTITDVASRRTFVVSLQISRLSEYKIPKINGNVEEQLAMTGSLYFTNVRTGEVLFTYTSTSYIDKTTRSETDTNGDKDLYAALSNQLTDDLIRKSAATFKPYEVTATALRSQGVLVVLDKGGRAGLGVGDTLSSPDGGEARIIFAEPNYSIAEMQLGDKSAQGGTWSRFSTRGLGEIRKVDAVVHLVRNDAQSEVPDAEAEQLFTDSLGEKAALSIVPVNPEFAEVMNYVRSHTDINHDVTAFRKPPAYYVRLSVPAPLVWEAPTNVGYKTVRNVRAQVYADLIDRSGRIQYSGVGESALSDEVTDAMGYAPQARVEIAVKNAITDLSRNMAADLKLERIDAPVTRVDQGRFAAGDPKGVLRVNANLTVLHAIGRLQGGDMALEPSWTAHVIDVGQTQASAAGDLAVFAGAPAIRAGDLARLEHVGSPVQTAQFESCGHDEALGTRKVAGLDLMGLSTFAGSKRANTYAPDQVEAEGKRLRETGDFADASDAAPLRPDKCVEPVNRIDLLKETCDPQGRCRTDITVAVGYRILRGGQIVKKAALQTTLHSSAYFTGITATDRNALIDADILAAAAPLFRSLAQQGDFNAADQGR